MDDVFGDRIDAAVVIVIVVVVCIEVGFGKCHRAVVQLWGCIRGCLRRNMLRAH